MWQFVLIVAVAGSGILVNQFFIRSADGGGGGDHPVRVSSVSQKTDQSNQGEEKENVMEVIRNEQQQEESFDIVKPDAFITSFGGVSSTVLTDSRRSQRQHESIFRFSSLDRAEEGSRSRPVLFKEKVNNAKRRTSTSSSNGGDKKNKFCFCLKRRRRTGNNAVRKCGSCLSKGNSLFSCGVGFGFMYLLSAGKAKINKLSADVEDFPTELISNLQSEVCERQLSRDLHDSRSEDRTDMEAVDKNKEPLMMTDSSVKLACPDDPKLLDLSSNDDGECASSILTEEVDLEALEMDKLEAEFESELQKIPSEPEPEYYMDCPSTELSVYALEGPQEPLGMDPNSSQFYGVSPTELDRKLCHVLIKQQGSQIAELESNLYLSQTKLREKDAELQKLKAVVCSLRDFSLETASVDDEAEYGVVLDEEEEKEKEMNSNADCLIYPRSVDDGSNKIAVVKEKKSLCGVKRVMEFESYANSHVIQIHNALVS